MTNYKIKNKNSLKVAKIYEKIGETYLKNRL